MSEKNKKEKVTIDDLALMIGKGFEHVDHRMDSLEKGQEEIIKNNAKDHEDMALRLDNVAYRFELVELKKRVEVLEQKAKVRA